MQQPQGGGGVAKLPEQHDAFLYGAGGEKLGFILTRQVGRKAVKAGNDSKEAFLAALPALAKLIKAVAKKAAERGFLLGLDGRRLKVRSPHAALNTLLQSAGAVQMKVALVLLDEALQLKGLIPGEHYEFVANVHDEWQIECLAELAEVVGTAAVQAIRDAGKALDFRCPLDGEWCTGATWADTH